MNQHYQGRGLGAAGAIKHVRELDMYNTMVKAFLMCLQT